MSNENKKTNNSEQEDKLDKLDKNNEKAFKDNRINKVRDDGKIKNKQEIEQRKDLNAVDKNECNDTHKQLELSIETRTMDTNRTKKNYENTYNKKKENDKVKKHVIPSGTLLEYRVKRLIFNLGYYPIVGIDLKTSYDETAEKITDLDVYGIYIHKDFTIKTVWADCKSGGVKIHDRLSWIKGIMGSIQINDAILVAGGVRTSVKQYAGKFGIQILDLNVIQKLENDYGIAADDWRGSWNPDTQYRKIIELSRLSIPTNDIYKRISKFISSDYWVMDNYSKCKKTLTALRELASMDSIPMSIEQIKSVKWAIFELIGMFSLAALSISKDIYYFTDREKKEIIEDGLSSGDIPNKKRAELIDAAFRVAYSSLKSQIPDFQVPIKMPKISLSQPSYSNDFCDLMLRITNKPIYFFDILRFIDFTLMEYDLNDKNYDEEVLRKMFNNYDNVLVGTKTILHFICHTTNIQKTLFSMLR